MAMVFAWREYTVGSSRPGWVSAVSARRRSLTHPTSCTTLHSTLPDPFFLTSSGMASGSACPTPRCAAPKQQRSVPARHQPCPSPAARPGAACRPCTSAAARGCQRAAPPPAPTSRPGAGSACWRRCPARAARTACLGGERSTVRANGIKNDIMVGQEEGPCMQRAM